MKRLENKVAIITGGASGMGEAITLKFAKEGAKVIACDVQDELLNAVVEKVNAEGGQAVAMHLDVAQEDQWKVVVEAAIKKYGTVDILVNNAGVTGPGGINVEDVDLETYEKVSAVNSRGPFLGIKHVAPTMKQNKKGSIVNIVSLNGILGGQTTVHYAASKGACRMINKSMGVELAKYGVRVNGIFPGFISTPMSAMAATMTEYYKMLMSQIPLGRPGETEEIANTALFLASDESSYITANEIVVDGGWGSHN